MTVKENQPSLYADLALFFKRPAGPQQDLRRVQQTNRGHGRLERHWAIENRLHWVKDVVLKEHASRVRTGQAPMILASLRNALVSCLRALGFDSITEGRRHFTLNFDEAAAFICQSLE